MYSNEKEDIFVNQETINKHIDHLLDILGDYGYYAVLWSAEHINMLCEQNLWPELSIEQTKSVFAIYKNLYPDKEEVTWKKLEAATRIYLQERDMIPKPTEARLAVNRAT